MKPKYFIPGQDLQYHCEDSELIFIEAWCHAFRDGKRVPSFDGYIRTASLVDLVTCPACKSTSTETIGGLGVDSFGNHQECEFNHCKNCNEYF